MSNILINTRLLAAETTGLQRYLKELITRFPRRFKTISPLHAGGVLTSHLWEQLVLPLKIKKGDYLFSPGNSGPISISRQIVTIHDVAPIDRPDWFDRPRAQWFQFMTPRLAGQAAHVITDSEYSKQRLLAHVPIDERRITVIPIGVDQFFSPQSHEQIERMRLAMNLPQGQYVLCVGTILDKRKNILRLLEAWSKIENDIPKDIWLILAGKHNDRDFRASLAQAGILPSRVHLSGHAPDEWMPALYAGALAFAFPSLYEGFGLPPLEAMACGTPVLTSNLTSLPEVVGDAAYMVDPLDVGQIADGLVSLIEDNALRSQLIAKGFKRAALYNWDESARRTWALLEEFAAQ